jgi:hypothetical protein
LSMFHHVVRTSQWLMDCLLNTTPSPRD